MKQEDVKIGEIYFCRVSGSIVQVRVIRKCVSPGISARTSYEVEHNGHILPKLRTAAALRKNRWG